MSNRLTIEPTEFKNVRTGLITLGVRMYDDYDGEYVNSWDSIPDTDLEVIAKVFQEWSNNEYNEGTAEMLSFIVENENGLYVGDQWYTWEQIKSLIPNED
jgi:hypothetical protein